MALCEIPNCEEHYGCRLKSKGLQVSPSATPSRHNGRRKQVEPPSWNKGILYDERPNGTKMPVMNNDGSPVRMKQASEQRHKINDHLRASRVKTTKD
jgi:hypothetical protein